MDGKAVSYRYRITPTKHFVISIQSLYIVIVLGTVFFRVFQGLYGSWISADWFGGVATAIRYLIVLCLLAILFLEGRMTGIKALLVLALVILLIFGYQKALVTGLMLVISYPSGLNSKKLVKYIAISLIVELVLAVFLSQVGVINDFVSSRLGGTRVRHSFGFVTASAFSAFYTVIVLCITYEKFEILRIRDIIFLELGGLVVYYYTDTRLGLLLVTFDTLVCLIFILGRNYFYWHGSFFSNFSFIPYVISAIFSIGSTIYLSHRIGSSLYFYLNTLLSGRINHQVWYYKNYGIHFWGSETELVGRVEQYLTGKAWNGVDNSYIFTLITYGIFGLLVVSSLFWIIAKYARKYKRHDLGGYLTMLAIMGITEAIFNDLPYNLAFLLAGEIVSENINDAGQKIPNITITWFHGRK